MKRYLNERGVALFFTFIVLVALTAAVVGYLSIAQYGTKSVANQVNDSQAISLAEAGLHKAIYYLINGNTAPDGSTDGGWRTSAYPADPGSGASDPKQESFGDGTYTMWVEDSDGDIQITARGTVNNSERIIRKTFQGPDWTEIIYDEFESSYGNWNDGGTDCIRYTGGTFAHQGNAAVNLQDNSSTSLVTSDQLSLSGYTQVLVEFWYYSNGLETDEDFWLQISTNGGSSYSTVQTWAEGTDFSNGSFYEESVIISGYTLTNNTRIRLRLDASNNGDDVYFDEIRVSASADPVGTLTDVADSWMEL